MMLMTVFGELWLHIGADMLQLSCDMPVSQHAAQQQNAQHVSIRLGET